MTPRARSASAAALVLALSAGGIALFAFDLLPLASPSSAPARPPRLTPEPVTAAAPVRGAVVRSTEPAAREDEEHEHEDEHERKHPHPLTPAHERLRRERHFVASLDDAMDARNGALLRETLEQYRREFPEDHQRLQTGYAVIADCLEHGERARAAAAHYYEGNRGSTLRRWVRRICLEPQG